LAVGESFLLAPARGHLKVWELSSGKQIREFARDAMEVRALQFSPQGLIVAQPVGGSAGEAPVTLWDVATGGVLRTFPGCTAMLLAFSPDGQTLACSGERIHVWDVATGRAYPRPQARYGMLTLVFSDDGKELVGASPRRGVYIWEVSSGRRVGGCSPADLQALRDPAALSPGAKLLAWGDAHKPLVHLWDVQACKEIRSFSMERATKKSGQSVKQ